MLFIVRRFSNTSGTLKELKWQLKPYTEFWEEWASDQACFLQKKEIELISVHMKNNFTLPLLKRISGYDDSTEQKIIIKLKHHFRLFREWVIFQFLCALIQIAKDDTAFFDTPIQNLNLTEALKRNLAALNTLTVRQIFEQYTDEDLSGTIGTELY